MPPAAKPLAAFEGLTTGHPLSAELAALLARVAADPVLTGAAAPPGVRVATRRDLRVAPAPERGRQAQIDHFYWCVQWRDPAAPSGLRARTLHYERGRGEPRTFDFPDDPLLPAAAAPGGPLDALDVEVLRYIPRRRITFRTGDLVGKIKRARSLERGHARLQAVFAAVRGARARFAVPEPMGLDAARGAFYQTLVPGTPVEQLLEPGNAERLLRALGAVHGELHELDADVPARDPGELPAVAREDAAWVAFAAPAHAAAMASVERWLVPALEAAERGARGFCHGDPALDQVLLLGDAFAIVDFDDAARGDPYADLGTMVAALPLDAPHLFRGPDALGERAVAAYLDGYRERAGTALDEHRLRVHRVRAELAVLASRLRKGQAGPAEVARSVARLQAGAADG
jgi:aminoglycoside phosphotransferase (APT) family kinase protein